MKTYTRYKKLQADQYTPVSIYQKLRDKHAQALLLESSDHHSKEGSSSVICLGPLATFSCENKICTVKTETFCKNFEISNGTELLQSFLDYRKEFKTLEIEGNEDISRSNFPFNCFFGYTSYNAAQLFHDLQRGPGSDKIPLVVYSFYSTVIIFNHFTDELFLFSNALSSELAEENLEKVQRQLENKAAPGFTFCCDGEEIADCSEEEYLEMVRKGKEHCKRGDVFQIVLSRKFERKFKGDEFEVYRALRNVNPSPYLFYFDFGNFRIFGSSPEAQLIVKKSKAEIHPIAGTLKRSALDEEDLLLAAQLKQNEKETAEHMMLVDLARNDLSRHCKNVQVAKLKEIQFYSHVIHLVSKVTGELKQNSDLYSVMKDSFPAGTLSGAPKHRAMQLIDSIENSPREFYGGAVGFIGDDSNFNHAIIIRSLMSKDNTLYYRAGAGITIASDAKSELQEVNNKAGAMRRAIENATAKFLTAKGNEQLIL